MVELILNLFSVSGGQAKLSSFKLAYFRAIERSTRSQATYIFPLAFLRLRKLVLILRGLRLARVARLAKLVNLPLLQELANIVSGPLVSHGFTSGQLLCRSKTVDTLATKASSLASCTWTTASCNKLFS